MKILLTGRNGQVGWELARSLEPLGEIVAFDRQHLDLADAAQIVTRLREVSPDVIVNAAAWTAVDAAEEQPEQAMAVNGTAPGILAEEAKRRGSLLVHYSTDYVFDGGQRRPYTEQDLPHPINVYGKTKLAGEQAIRASGCRHLILRTAWVYSARGKNFLLTMLRLARERSQLRVVDDQTGAPTWARDIAAVTRHILQQSDDAGGLCHVTASGQTTWCGFAQAIVELSGLQTAVLPVPSSEYPVPAPRPAYSVLDLSRLSARYGVSPRHWRSGLAECLQAIKTS